MIQRTKSNGIARFVHFSVRSQEMLETRFRQESGRLRDHGSFGVLGEMLLVQCGTIRSAPLKGHVQRQNHGDSEMIESRIREWNSV